MVAAKAFCSYLITNRDRVGITPLIIIFKSELAHLTACLTEAERSVILLLQTSFQAWCLDFVRKRTPI
jgi:hypothetical protein